MKYSRLVSQQPFKRALVSSRKRVTGLNRHINQSFLILMRVIGVVLYLETARKRYQCSLYELREYHLRRTDCVATGELKFLSTATKSFCVETNKFYWCKKRLVQLR